MERTEKKRKKEGKKYWTKNCEHKEEKLKKHYKKRWGIIKEDE